MRLLQSARAFLADHLIAERERWALWIPAAIGLGVAVYFCLPAEPSLLLGGMLLVAAAALLLLLRKSNTGRAAAIALLAAALGFAAAELRTAFVTAPALAQKFQSVRLEGRVRDVEFLPGGRRVRLGEVTIPGIVDPPAEIRLRLAGARSAAGAGRLGTSESDAKSTLAPRSTRRL